MIKRYIRLTNDTQYSEWLPKGVFFTNRRTVEDNLWTVEAYDAMLKADITWTTRPGFTFPCTMEAAVRDIAYSMDVELDERNVYQPYTMKEYPAGEYNRRDALMDIGAAHGGNWYISDEGKLRLVPLISFPKETNYLVTEHGDAILFGGTRILLAPSNDTAQSGAGPSHPADGSKFYVGLDVTGFENHGKDLAATSVTFQVDSDNVITAGTYAGMDLYAICPYATQEMALNVLLQTRGYQYQAFSADAANLDPAAELGDGVDVGGIYSVISAIEDNGDGYPSLSAPGETELEDEYQYRSTAQRELSGDVDSLRAFIQKWIGEMQIELNSMKTAIQELTLKVNDISDRVTQLEGR